MVRDTHVGDVGKMYCFTYETDDGSICLEWRSYDREVMFFLCLDKEEPSWHFIDKDYKNMDYGIIPDSLIEVLDAWKN